MSDDDRDIDIESDVSYDIYILVKVFTLTEIQKWRFFILFCFFRKATILIRDKDTPTTPNIIPR